MAEPGALIAVASILTGIAVAALICGACFPLLMPAKARGHGDALAALLRRLAGDATPEVGRSAHRAQAVAMKLVAEERRLRSMTRLSHKLDQAGLDWQAPR